MKKRIAVLVLFSFLVSVAAAPLAWSAEPSWPKEGVPTGTVAPTPEPQLEGKSATNIESVVIEADVVEEAVSPTEAAAAPAEAPPAEPAADAAQAGEDDGEKVAAGFFSGSKGKWAAFGAAALAVGIIAVGAGSTSNH